MIRDYLKKLAEDFIDTTPFNHLGPHTNDAEDVYGLRVFDSPLMAIGRADDPYWKKLWEPQIVGQQFMLPEEWVPGAKSVISFFLPATKKIKDETKELFDVRDSIRAYLALEQEEEAEELCEDRDDEGTDDESVNSGISDLINSLYGSGK